MKRAVERVVLVPGNGCTSTRRSLWYGSVADALAAAGFSVVCEDMPDPFVARESVWVPFLREQGANANALVIGHSSGAEAAMRLAESDALAGLVLVSACHTDLGDANERASGYYARPWQWEAIRGNVAHYIDQWGSPDDHLVPFDTEQQHVHRCLQSRLHVVPDRGHFQDDDFPELVELVCQQYEPAQ